MIHAPDAFPGYTLLSELGLGTTGVVYLAEDHQIRRFAALKTLLPCPEALRIERATRFLREVQVVASIEHDYILPLYQVNEYEGRPYSVRPFVDGHTLGELATAKSIDLRTGLRLLSQVCEAVVEVHARGFAHRNLCPANVLVESASGDAKLAGFGRVGMLAGSPHLPPGTSGTSPFADVQALYQMLHSLAYSLDQPLPPELAALDISTPAALAEALRRHV